MEFLNQIQSYLSSLERKRFNQYVGGLLGFIAIVMLLLMFQYYRKVSYLKTEAIALNEQREDTQKILRTAQQIQDIQKENETILAQDKNFRIAHFFEDLIGKLGLVQKKSSVDLTVALGEGKFRENILTAKFTAVTMKEITELLQDIEQNKRVFVKELTLEASKKQKNSIDVTLVIATLEPKPQESGESSE